MIRVEPVSEATFQQVVDMRLPEEQAGFVAPNLVSLAQAWLHYDTARPYAILDEEDRVVGFLLLDWLEEERKGELWRLIIAPEHQHKGYGRQAVELAIRMFREAGKFDAIYLDYVKGNTGARDLYRSLGFRETGEEAQGEIIMKLSLTHPAP